MPAFGGKHVMAFAVPVKAGFAKTSAGSNHRLISRRNADLVERNQMLGGERANTPASRLEIVD